MGNQITDNPAPAPLRHNEATKQDTKVLTIFSYFTVPSDQIDQAGTCWCVGSFSIRNQRVIKCVP